MSSVKPHELERMRSSFYRTAPNGQVTLDQFRHVMTALGCGDLPHDRLFKVFDTHKSNSVDYKEFLVGLSILKCGRKHRDKALRLIFQVQPRSVVRRRRVSITIPRVFWFRCTMQLETATSVDWSWRTSFEP